MGCSGTKNDQTGDQTNKLSQSKSHQVGDQSKKLIQMKKIRGYTSWK